MSTCELSASHSLLPSWTWTWCLLVRVVGFGRSPRRWCSWVRGAVGVAQLRHGGLDATPAWSLPPTAQTTPAITAPSTVPVTTAPTEPTELPATRTPVGEGLTAFGDSVMSGATAQLQAAGFAVDVAEARQASQMVAEVQAAAAAGPAWCGGRDPGRDERHGNRRAARSARRRCSRGRSCVVPDGARPPAAVGRGEQRTDSGVACPVTTTSVSSTGTPGRLRSPTISVSPTVACIYATRPRCASTRT